ncbi:hypothetical protein AXG93_3912s1020 [Marchantia polymorpha subsp. ruderalis]|uniref:Uncharacterized protein n=1 Tax=Marchantia polymorpha subsp. ruderalis TaxID=1480154 RepID=A0A176W0S9_MARPO|nr:hypothetical protein AXG93_3912s1020 [Marchantia polymorpha subsp. ruderalis]
MKARQLILEAESSTESSVAASQGFTPPGDGAELEVETDVRKKSVLLKKYLWTFEMRPLPVVKRRATRKEKRKLQDLERHATAMIACSVSGQRLDQNSDSKATADSADVMPVWSSHQSK